MPEVVVTGLGPLLANCADRRTLWTHLCEGPSQLTFGLLRHGTGGHDTVTLVGAVGAT